MKRIIKYKVVNILNNSIINGKFTTIPAMGGSFAAGDRWEITEIFSDKNDAIKIAKELYKKYPPIKGEYRNWAVVEELYDLHKRIKDRLIKRNIIFVANPNFIIK